MLTAIQVVWWVGLVGALLLTLVILKEVSLVVGTLRDIARLAQRTRDAAHVLAEHLDAVPRLREAAGPGAGVRDAAHALARAAGSMERRLATLAGPPEA